MSILWRTQDWLNFGELTLAWAAELSLPVAELRKHFLADISAGALDDVVPARLVIRPGGPNESVTTSVDLNQFVAEHRNSGWVTVEASRLPPIGGGIGLLTFDRARELQDLVHPADVVTYLWHALFVSRAMTLAFARLRELRPPTWWRPRPAPEPVDSAQPHRILHADISPDEEASRTGQRRAAYRGALDSWMAQQQLPVLQKMGATAIAREFKSQCEQRLPGVVPLLPKRLRSMEGVIERIIKRRVEALRTQNRSRNSAGNGQ